jgi:hypothetical protein
MGKEREKGRKGEEPNLGVCLGMQVRCAGVLPT